MEYSSQANTFTHRFDFSNIRREDAWAEKIAEEIIAQKPNETVYTLAAGISPSGIVHFGNFRDIATAHFVREALIQKGKQARLIFSWDNFDRYRKVPVGVPESFVEHIGKPLSSIPDPFPDAIRGTLPSYAERFQKPFIEAIEKLNIEIEYRDQTKLYQSGMYDEAIFHTLKERKRIADILLSFMTEKAKKEKGIDPDIYRENYYPIAVYSRFTGKDSTKILSYDGGTHVTYLCEETGNIETVDLAKEHIAKCAWKIDWPMRWKHEQVHFEPGGHDHASPGGSYDVASVIAKEIFNYDAPIFAEYKFVGIQGLGSKMSGSKGNAVSLLDLLDIYEPEVLKWLYARKSPTQSFELAFNSEIYRQYNEYDTAHPEETRIPFRQAVSFGQIVQWQEDKLNTILVALQFSYSKESIQSRLPLAKKWLTKYNPNEMITLREMVYQEYADTLTEKEKEQVRVLRKALIEKENASIPELEALTYHIPKSPGQTEAELKKAQRAFFKTIYILLINRDTGPRLGTFLWATDRKKVLALLDI